MLLLLVLVLLQPGCLPLLAIYFSQSRPSRSIFLQLLLSARFYDAIYFIFSSVHFPAQIFLLFFMLFFLISTWPKGGGGGGHSGWGREGGREGSGRVRRWAGRSRNNFRLFIFVFPYFFLLFFPLPSFRPHASIILPSFHFVCFLLKFCCLLLFFLLLLLFLWQHTLFIFICLFYSLFMQIAIKIAFIFTFFFFYLSLAFSLQSLKLLGVVLTYIHILHTHTYISANTHIHVKYIHVRKSINFLRVFSCLLCFFSF